CSSFAQRTFCPGKVLYAVQKGPSQVWRPKKRHAEQGFTIGPRARPETHWQQTLSQGVRPMSEERRRAASAAYAHVGVCLRRAAGSQSTGSAQGASSQAG